MNILVYGASGATGHELVKQALAQGHNVTAFARNPSKLKIGHDKLKVIQGDVINYQLVEGAVKGLDAVLSALGAASLLNMTNLL
jgi:putative NADH-flavin reductase